MTDRAEVANRPLDPEAHLDAAAEAESPVLARSISARVPRTPSLTY
jgi:hypothetical protein